MNPVDRLHRHLAEQSIDIFEIAFWILLANARNLARETALLLNNEKRSIFD